MNAPIIEKRFREPDVVAKINRELLNRSKVFAVNVAGGPGCGKTSLIDATIDLLAPDFTVGAIACDIASHRDSDRMKRHSEHVVQVNTGDRHAPDATDIYAALEWLDLPHIDLLLIENIGSLIEPVVDLGQHATAAVFSVAGGHDKADKHEPLVAGASVVLLNKCDLLGVVPFELASFRADVNRINPAAEVFEVSAIRRPTLGGWLKWLKRQLAAANSGESKWFG